MRGDNPLACAQQDHHKRSSVSVMRILSVFGTRPEAIKMAPLMLALAEAEAIESRVCVTGQHRQMLDDVMSAFSLKADYDLNIMRPNQALSDVFSAVMTG